MRPTSEPQFEIFETYPEFEVDSEFFEQYEEGQPELYPELDGEISPFWSEFNQTLLGEIPEAGPSPPAIGAGYFKDSPHLQRIPLQPPALIRVAPKWPSHRRMLAFTYNRLGGLMRALASEASIEVEATLAVWYVESAGRKHAPGRAIIRFENHLFYRLWGKSNDSTYGQYFSHGGYRGGPGRSWENHKFRENAADIFRPFHGNQEFEYRVLALARRLAGDSPALMSISIGGPQILISNYRLIGYRSPQEMFNAFQSGERAHVLGFFDFCNQRKAPQQGNLIRHLQNHQWANFARYYNGPGQTQGYGGKIANAYNHAIELSIPA